MTLHNPFDGLPVGIVHRQKGHIMRYLLYLPGIILILLPFLSMWRAANKADQAQREQEARRAAAAEQRRIEIERKRAIQAAKAAEREKVKIARDAEQQRKQAARLEIARQRAEYAERELTAKREARAIERAETISQPVEQSAAQTNIAPQLPVFERHAAKQRPQIMGNNAFAGQTVAFTGKLPGMSRREAIQAVIENGGRAYEKMPAGTTLLVVGQNPGMNKMDKADEWIGQVRKITAEQFFVMLKQPLTMTLDEFAATFAA